MTITEIEFNVLKIMAEKDIDWNWMVLDRTLAMREVPGFSNVANIVTNLVNNGFVDVVYREDKSRSRFRVSQNGFNFLKDRQ